MEGATPGDIMSLAWLLIPIILAWLNTYLFEGLQSVVEVLAGLPAIIKQILYTTIQFLLLHLAVVIGLPLPEALVGIMPEILLAITTALVGMGLHKKGKDAVSLLDPAKAAHR